MALEDELATAAAAAGAFGGAGELLTAVVAAEPSPGLRVYLCAWAAADAIAWLAVGRDGRPIGDRAVVRDAVSIMGLCELAEESAAGGDVDALRARLAELREVEGADGIEKAEEAVAALAAVLQPPPRLATPSYLDAIGTAVTRVEQALGEIGGSPFAAAMMVGAGAVEELAKDVERRYKVPLG